MLVNLFGYAQSIQIVQQIRKLNVEEGQDRQIFKPATNGQFSVKKAYGLLQPVANDLDPQMKELLEMVWNKGNITPRVRLHLWKLINKAVPLGAIIHRRITRANPICQLCGQEEETVMHHVFRCPFAKLCHLMGPIALRSHELTGSFIQVLAFLGSHLDADQWSQFVSSIWAIWRCRNEDTYGGKKTSLENFKAYFHSIQWESTVGAGGNFGTGGRDTSSHPVLPQPKLFTCYLDGSWIPNWYGGLGYVIFRSEELVQYRSVKAIGGSPLAIEALALKSALSTVKELGIDSCTFISDCKILVEAVSDSRPPADVDWRAFSVILKLWDEFRSNENFECIHIARESNTLADRLAKLGRICSWDCTGFTFPCFAS